MPVDHAQLDRDFVWHPFTQQQGWSEEEPLVIERGEGSYLFDSEGRRYLDGTAALMERMEKIAARFRVKPPRCRFLICRIRHRTRLSQEIEQAVRARFGAACFQVTISDSVRMQEAPSHHLPITEYAQAHRVAQEFRALAREWGRA